MDHLQGDKEYSGDTKAFIGQAIRSKNIAFFVGSGCSAGAVDLMSETMSNILKKNSDILECVTEYLSRKHPLKDFIEWYNAKNRNSPIDNYYDKNCDKKFYELDDEIKKKYLNDFRKYAKETPPDIEKFLTWLNSCIDSGIEFGNINFGDVYKKLKKLFIESIPSFGDPKYDSGETRKIYGDFYRRVFELRFELESTPSKISIFTTNYDLFNEYGLEDAGVSYSTGISSSISRKFDINNFKYRVVDNENRYKDKWDPVSREANLYKLHGSINWVMDNDGKCLIERDDATDTDKVVIYPTVLKHRETAQSPYSELFREFANKLKEKNTTLVVIGYGFGDDHINNIISQNLRNSDFTLLVFGDMEQENIKAFMDDNKKNTFHIVGGDNDESEKSVKVHYFDYIVNEFLGVE